MARKEEYPDSPYLRYNVRLQTVQGKGIRVTLSNFTRCNPVPKPQSEYGMGTVQEVFKHQVASLETAAATTAGLGIMIFDKPKDRQLKHYSTQVSESKWTWELKPTARENTELFFDSIKTCLEMLKTKHNVIFDLIVVI